MHFFSPMPINSSKLNFLYLSKIILENIFTLFDLSVSANGDGASDLQVSMAALAVYWMVQLVTP
jgi:hypothetical protein